jgi:predicted  nucleic acid-binding Zn-ribbon protein
MQNLLLAVIVGLIVALSLALFDRHRLQNEVSGLERDIGTYIANIKSLGEDIKAKDVAIDNQNKAIDKLVEEAALREKDAALALEKAKKDSAKSKKLATDLLLEKRQTDNACKDAEDLINRYLGFTDEKLHTDAGTPGGV